MKQKKVTINVPTTNKLSKARREKLEKEWKKEVKILRVYYAILIFIAGLMIGMCLGASVVLGRLQIY